MNPFGENGPRMPIEIKSDLMCSVRFYITEIECVMPGYFDSMRKPGYSPYIDDIGKPYYLSAQVPLKNVFFYREGIRQALINEANMHMIRKLL